MQFINLGGTDLQTSRMGFGTSSLHHVLRARNRQALLGAARDAGFTHFDTARMYGEGLAERELGRFLGKERQHVTLATKFGIPAIPSFERFPLLMYAQRVLSGMGRRPVTPGWEVRRLIGREQAEKSLAASLQALRTDWIDILFVHEPRLTDVVPLQGMADWLERQKTSGRVRWLGLAGSAARCVEVARQTDGLFDILQVEDSWAEHEADAVIAAGWPLQITFGYLRRAAVVVPSLSDDATIRGRWSHGSRIAAPPGVEDAGDRSESIQRDALAVMRAALARNRHGVVLVSSRQPERLQALAALAA